MSNFRRNRPRQSGGARRNDWRSWRSSGVIKRLFRQSGTTKPEKPVDEQAMWEEYLRNHFGDENW